MQEPMVAHRDDTRLAEWALCRKTSLAVCAWWTRGGPSRAHRSVTRAPPETLGPLPPLGAPSERYRPGDSKSSGGVKREGGGGLHATDRH